MGVSDIIQQLLDDLSSRMQAGNSHLEDDGLLYCNNCNTPIQTEITIGGRKRIVLCLCKCQKEKADAEEQQFRQSQQYMEIQKNIECGLKDSAYRNMTFSNSDIELETEKKYCEKFDEMLKLNAGLLFTGKCGCGKTFRAGCIANELLHKGYTVYMDNITSLCMSLQGKMDKSEYISSISKYDLLILDDMGAERKTDYMIELVYNIIDTRYRSEKPLIITTNLDIRDFKSDDVRMARTYDRIKQMCSYPVIVKDESRRTKKGNDNFQILKGLLE